MPTAPVGPTSGPRVPALLQRSDRRLAAALVGLSVLALAARLYRLGHRVLYYDEASFGYWTLRFTETGAWHARMPLPWYTEAAGADVASVADVGNLPADPPPVVVTTLAARNATGDRLGDGYRSERYRLDDVGDREVVVFRRTPSATSN